MRVEQKMVLTIRQYTQSAAAEWDRFVEESRNGTFLHKRGYMDYHADRFTDHSLMCYTKDKLAAILPGHIKDNAFCSHNGLTYGGLLLSNDTTAELTLEIFNAILEYLRRETSVTKFIYKPTPQIYHRYPCEEDLYALFRNNATLAERKISSTIKLRDALPFKGRRKLTTAMQSRMQIVEDNDFASFWQVLESRLESKYKTTPVHSLAEIELLHSRFPENIRLFRITDEEENTLAGAILYITDNVAHLQYSSTTTEGRNKGALDYLHKYLLTERLADKEYFDFGTSVEDGGRTLNCGLIAYKEGFGGRAVVYDTYIIDLKEEVE